MELQLVNEWVKSAEGCFAAGDIVSMRACGRQMLEESPGNPLAMALIAEASVYMQDFQEAESWLEKNSRTINLKKRSRHSILIFPIAQGSV